MSEKKVRAKSQNGVDQTFGIINRVFDQLGSSAPVRVLFEFSAIFALSHVFQEFTNSALWLPIA